MTIKDIARESGYAVGTVSRVLNDHPNVSPKARERILEVVRRTGFQPNSNARSLKRGSAAGPMDDVLAAKAAALHLRTLGHRAIGILAAESGTSRARAEALARELDGAETAWGQASLEGGYAGAKSLLEQGRVTALLALCDLMAVGALRAAKDLGVRVPEDVSVMGCDDLELAGYCVPRLTTVRRKEGGPFVIVPGESVGKITERKKDVL